MEIGERLLFEATRDAQTIGIGQIEEVRIMVEGKIRFLLTQSYCSFFLKADWRRQRHHLRTCYFRHARCL